MSNRRNLTSTMSPSRRDVTSCRRRSRSSASISSTINSTCSSVTCCLAHALANPARNFSRSNGSFPPSRSEEHTSELQSHRDLHSFPTRRSSDLVDDQLHLLVRDLLLGTRLGQPSP